MPGSRWPNVSPKTNQVLPSDSNIEPRSVPATPNRSVLLGESGPVIWETLATFATPDNTNGSIDAGASPDEQPDRTTTSAADTGGVHHHRW